MNNNISMYECLKTFHPGGIRTLDLPAMTTMPRRQGLVYKIHCFQTEVLKPKKLGCFKGTNV
jgi:hypothetical protein